MVHVRVASLFAELAPDDVQLIPVDVEGQSAQYLILVATRLIDRAKVGSAKVCWCEGWTGALIVSGELKDALARMGATGSRFEEV